MEKPLNITLDLRNLDIQSLQATSKKKVQKSFSLDISTARSNNSFMVPSKLIPQETRMCIYSIVSIYTQLNSDLETRFYKQVLEDADLINEAFPCPEKSARDACNALIDYIKLKKKYMVIGQDSSNFDYVIRVLINDFKSKYKICPTEIFVKKMFSMYSVDGYLNLSNFSQFFEDFISGNGLICEQKRLNDLFSRCTNNNEKMDLIGFKKALVCIANTLFRKRYEIVQGKFKSISSQKKLDLLCEGIRKQSKELCMGEKKHRVGVSLFGNNQ